MKSVAYIFGSEAKTKIIRLFIFNPSATFTSKDVSKRVKESAEKSNKEIRVLVGAGLIKRKAKGYTLDPAYPYTSALEDFLMDVAPITEKEILGKINKVGNIKLLLISGIFIHNKDARADILVVGDHLKNSRLATAISSLEAELGRELRYAVFETADFRYRLGIYDKLIRDILDSQHQKIVNKLGI